MASSTACSPDVNRSDSSSFLYQHFGTRRPVTNDAGQLRELTGRHIGPSRNRESRNTVQLYDF